MRFAYAFIRCCLRAILGHFLRRTTLKKLVKFDFPAVEESYK
ncbi:hypothetical protein Pint_29652 [Pistacia integerrima]|uniref:Uncharacterized protein n=1 Tax=Pistacia integerrima TaxID=434235 RepID=A0ACC0WXR1_9ROSI|nr:hypothetical protein Pint_29652 [Pistacia integerrima]